MNIEYFIVGREETMRLSLVITPSFSGTLKSQRTSTFLPATSISSIVFLFSASMNDHSFHLGGQQAARITRRQTPNPCSTSVLGVSFLFHAVNIV